MTRLSSVRFSSSVNSASKVGKGLSPSTYVPHHSMSRIQRQQGWMSPTAPLKPKVSRFLAARAMRSMRSSSEMSAENSLAGAFAASGTSLL